MTLDVAVVVTPELLALGLITGVTVGLLSVGLVLVHRSSKVINFAQGEIGAFGATITGVLIVRWGVPYWIAMLVGIASGAVAGGIAEVVVVRRLRAAPRLMTMVATLGLSQFLFAFSGSINGLVSASQFPQPPWMPRFHIGALLVTRAYSGMLVLSPIVVTGLVVFLRRSRFGLAIRASAADSERALMVGISAAHMSTLAWLIAGAMSAFTVILLLPTRGFISSETVGPTLLLRALAPAVFARMNSLPIAMAGGLAIGVVDQVLLFNNSGSGISEVLLLGVILLALLLQSRRGGREQEREPWAALQPWRPMPDALRGVRTIRMLGPATAVGALAAAVGVGIVATNNSAVTLTAVAVFAIAGLSLGVTTGLTGQLSLGQFALAGVGTVTAYVVTSATDNPLLALAAAAAIAAGASMLLGLPALRIPGLSLGVVTLAFALASQRFLLGQTWALGAGVDFTFPKVGPVAIGSARGYYFWSLGVLVVTFIVARNVWRGAIGTRLRAGRDNEDALRAFGLSATVAKMQGFAIGGAVAGVAGAVLGPSLARISPGTFPVAISIDVVALTVLGGLGLLAGPLLGAIYIIGLPRFLPLDNAGLAATSLGWLLLILYYPRGLAALIAGPRQRILDLLARRAGVDIAAVRAEDDSEETTSFRRTLTRVAKESHEHNAAPEAHDLLVATGLAKRFGGVQAVDGVDLVLHRDEILGLLGPNGAGKTTLFELIGGFTTPDAGSVRLGGRELSGLPAHARAQLGLIRSFQDAALFSTLTVLETVKLSFERQEPTSFLASLAGIDASSARKETCARELISLMGLDRYRHKQINELSTGTRRITELACILALEPRVLLLDEPSSGIAQRESEALCELLRQIREALGCSMIIIEHDVPLMMALSDRVMAMDAGQVIAVGDADAIKNHPKVIESYLGGNTVAVERSGAVKSLARRARRSA